MIFVLKIALGVFIGLLAFQYRQLILVLIRNILVLIRNNLKSICITCSLFWSLTLFLYHEFNWRYGGDSFLRIFFRWGGRVNSEDVIVGSIVGLIFFYIIYLVARAGFENDKDKGSN